ncbi:uncharacterized protein LOC142977895 [Anticarsia gemmatalis]|uniref:uncharacterized protein LOC142977895 n=1 Tax=Anticarsia gemmatalis TaxID=129554 RepID=UPI003F772E90
MELLNENEISLVAKQCGFTNVLKWSIEKFEDKTIGNLGEHLNLIIIAESNGKTSEIKLFVKCMPRFNKWKTEYINELKFFKKEYTMLGKLFPEFENLNGTHKWKPKLLLVREDLFVFENVTLQGYFMPHHQDTLTFEQIEASVATLARFHAQALIFEEQKSRELGRPYRIWEDYSDYLQEPMKTIYWRNTGKKAVIDFLQVFSKYKSRPDFSEYLELVVPTLYDRAIELMKPSTEYRNVVVHRDLWTNNIFLKKEAGLYHALFVDFQTVLYCSPMLDLSSLIYFNTSRSDRNAWTNQLIQFYYTVLSKELEYGGVNVGDIFDKDTIMEAYEKSIVFGITQASLITPIIAMSKARREEIFFNPETAKVANLVTRSKELIGHAEEDERYRTRLTELFDEMVERFVLPQVNRTTDISSN